VIVIDVIVHCIVVVVEKVHCYYNRVMIFYKIHFYGLYTEMITSNHTKIYVFKHQAHVTYVTYAKNCPNLSVKTPSRV
jgi:hypothetical protein